MIRLPFVPRYFPVLLVPVWWLFLLCFYLFYVPVYFLCWIFSPWSPRKSEADPFRVRASKKKRTMETQSSGKEGS